MYYKLKSVALLGARQQVWATWTMFALISSASKSGRDGSVLEQRLVTDGQVVRYKVAWIGGANVLYDRARLLSVGGFSWWHRLPPEHAGEEVVVQFLLIRKYGGCGILPSGTYHLGLPTTVEDRTHNATELFEELVQQYNVHPVLPIKVNS